jgi:hypothetical protein
MVDPLTNTLYNKVGAPSPSFSILVRNARPTYASEDNSIFPTYLSMRFGFTILENVGVFPSTRKHPKVIIPNDSPWHSNIVLENPI